MNEDLLLIDKLEYEIIDHPDAATKRDLVEGSLDQTFQKKLNQRAEQIRSNQNSNNRQDEYGMGGLNGSKENFGSVNYQFLISKYHLQFEYEDMGLLDQEINEWFTYYDQTLVGPLDSLPDIYYSLKGDDSDISLILGCIDDLKRHKRLMDGDIILTNAVKVLIYYAFGTYDKKTLRYDQLESIIRNNKRLAMQKHYCEQLYRLVTNFIDERISADRTNLSFEGSSNDPDAANFIRILTLIYFQVNVALFLQDDHPIRINVLDGIVKANLLSKLIEFLEHGKWAPNPKYRIRNVILLVWKLILLEMGDTRHLKRCDEFLTKYHGIKNKRGTDGPVNKLTCTPMEYFAFREDTLDKYPLFDDPNLKNGQLAQQKEHLRSEHSNEEECDEQKDESQSNTSDELETRFEECMALSSHSDSILNLLEMPRTNKSHSVLSQLPAQTVHIATPAPSPTLAPSDYMTGGEKIRRSFQVNQALPFLYPNDSSTVQDTLEGSNMTVPYAIQEADNILKNSIYESYSAKRLWAEKMRFMRQERGYSSEYRNHDEDDDINENLCSQYPDDQNVIKSLIRVEHFYKANLKRLNSLVQVLMETIKVNRMDYNLNYAELELNSSTSFFKNSSILQGKSDLEKDEAKEKVDYILMLQLEMIDVKEVTLKASSSILILLLQWFKKSHILKYYYLSSILSDQQFLSVSLDYMSHSFNNQNLQKWNGDDDKHSPENNQLSEDNEERFPEYEVLISQNKIMNPRIELPRFDFFNNCLKQYPTDHSYQFIDKIMILQLPTVLDSDHISNTYIKSYNKNYCIILSNLLHSINKILIKSITQRIFTLNELKPSELFKMIITNFNCKALTTPILHALRKLIPYQGRKWKSTNMDLISQIYLKLDLSMKDTWLSGKDLEFDFNNSYDQEVALRALLQFYNVRNYPEQMELMGYKISVDRDIPPLDLNDEQGESDLL